MITAEEYINRFREIYHRALSHDKRVNASYQICSFGTVVWFELVDISNYIQEIEIKEVKGEEPKKFWRREYGENRFAILTTDLDARRDANEQVYKLIQKKREAMKVGDVVYLDHPHRNAQVFIKGEIKELQKPGFVLVSFENCNERLLIRDIYPSLEDLIWDKKEKEIDFHEEKLKLIDRAASNILSKF